MLGNGGKISVVMPTYNRAHFLGKAIDSVLSQTYENFEVIIIDDNSKDNTTDLLRSYNDKRIKYVKNSENRESKGGNRHIYVKQRGCKASCFGIKKEIQSENARVA